MGSYPLGVPGDACPACRQLLPGGRNVTSAPLLVGQFPACLRLGTGYSSLAYLKRLPVDEIKIDRSFVRDVMDDPNDAALIDTILTLARHIKLEVVAEGVENEAAFDFLRQRGCPVFQGFHFGRPCPADEFSAQFLPVVGEALRGNQL